MISLNVMRMECLRVVDVVSSRSNGWGPSFVFTLYKNGVRKPPLSTADACFISTCATSTTRRLNREDCSLIKLDSVFSKWKMLVGAHDWEDHSMGKEGAERYATQNLPNCTSPGIYELAVVIDSGKELRKLYRCSIVPVYVGQADNVRARLQTYGRDGGHLEHLFSATFCRDYSIVYRWGPMKSKKEAERSEKKLLALYDYAWNKTGNGDRRANDIYSHAQTKLESCPKQSYLFVVCTKQL